MKKDKTTIAQFLKGENLAVLSTADKRGRPESAVVAFAETKALEIVFGTSNTSRKYENLKKNPKVSMVVGWSLKDRITVQFEGTVRGLSGNEKEKYAKTLIAKNKFTAKFHDLPDQRYFVVRPEWIRYSDYKEGSFFELEF